MQGGRRCDGATSPAASLRCTPRPNPCAKAGRGGAAPMYGRPMYGRLADPDSTIGTDPRSDPRMVAALAPLALDGRYPQPALTVDAPLEKRRAFVAEIEENTGAVLDMFAQSVPIFEGVTTTTTTIEGTDGNDVTLYISRPDAGDGALPCVVHLHGGAMAFLSAADIGYMRGREYLAATGLVVVGVEFRNSAGKLGPHPYPAGLNDCATGVRWTYANRSDLGVSHLIVGGESGGGNLTLAVPHKAKREGGCTRSPVFTRSARSSRTAGWSSPTICHH